MDESKQILMTLSRLEANVNNLTTKIDDFGKVSELALQTNESVKSAHNRLDDYKEDLAIKLSEQKADYEKKIQDQKEVITEIRGNITWLWRTVGGGVISLIFGVILLLITRFTQ